jgi:hypothetical protein
MAISKKMSRDLKVTDFEKNRLTTDLNDNIGGAYVEFVKHCK